MSSKKKSRRPYAPPAVKTSKLYERSALACGKTPRENRTSRACRGNPRAS
ncbi:MAG TPA: hypothetical protein VEJ18_14460 [Planctomycetota bacterium]|nr:hypothetical protein [Planctomycetota bacterium]